MSTDRTPSTQFRDAVQVIKNYSAEQLASLACLENGTETGKLLIWARDQFLVYVWFIKFAHQAGFDSDKLWNELPYYIVSDKPADEGGLFDNYLTTEGLGAILAQNGTNVCDNTMEPRGYIGYLKIYLLMMLQPFATQLRDASRMSRP
jgi:hypothetical protein